MVAIETIEQIFFPWFFWDDYEKFDSKSRIQTMNFCEYQYKKSYVFKEKTSSYATVIGSRIHHWLEIFYDYAHLIPVEQWELCITSEYCDYERRMLLNFIRDEKVRLERLNYDFKLWKPLARELKVINEEHKIRGLIDRITGDPLVLEDYKKYLMDKYMEQYEYGDSETKITKKEIKVLTNIVEGKIKEIVCIGEYKTSRKVDVKSLSFEFGFYKVLLKSLPEYKDKFMIGELINPRLNVRQFIPIQEEVYVLKALDRYRKVVESGEFKKECNRILLHVCGRCSLEECGLYDGIDPEWNVKR